MNHTLLIHSNQGRDLTFRQTLAVQFPDLSVKIVLELIDPKDSPGVLVINQSGLVADLIEIIPKQIDMPLFKESLRTSRVLNILEALFFKFSIPERLQFFKPIPLFGQAFISNSEAGLQGRCICPKPSSHTRIPDRLPFEAHREPVGHTD